MNTFKRMYWALRKKGYGKDEAYCEVKKHFERITRKKAPTGKTVCNKQSTLDKIKGCF